MNNRQILASINEIANELEDLGFMREASELTGIMKRLAQAVQSPTLNVRKPVKPNLQLAPYEEDEFNVRKPVKPNLQLAPYQEDESGLRTLEFDATYTPIDSPSSDTELVNTNSGPTLQNSNFNVNRPVKPNSQLAQYPVAPGQAVLDENLRMVNTNAGDTANLNEQEAKANPSQTTIENQLYTQKINEIAALLNTKQVANRDIANKIYEDTILKFKDTNRKILFNKQYQDIVKRNFPFAPKLPAPYNLS